MDKGEAIIAGASSVFETSGFRGVGVDAVLAPSGVSTRTFYKHFGSRDALVQAVLESRHRRFMERLDDISAVDPVGELFDQLQLWLEEYGSRGCMLLRARSEYASASADIVALVRRQKEEFRREIGRRVARTLGCESPAVTVQIWLLFEGAMAAASVSDVSVVVAAKQAATLLVAAAREGAK